MSKFVEWVALKFKNPLTPMFFIFGAVLVLLGVTNGLNNLPILNQLASDAGFRWVCVALGVGCFVVSIVTLYRPPKADAQSIYQVHRYSGTWSVQNRFRLWRSKSIEEPDRVSFDGKTLLVIPSNGKGGSGIQIGKLQVRFKSYRATYEIVNEVQRASVDKDDTLRMHVKVIRRQLIKEDPPPPKEADAEDIYADLRGGLKNSEFDLVLKPVLDTPNQLQGSHIHEEALYENQKAREKYVHEGLFDPPGL